MSSTRHLPFPGGYQTTPQPDPEDYPVKDMNSWGEQERRLIDRHIEMLEQQNRKPESDVVNQPDHYVTGGLETIDAIREALGPEQFIGFCRGNALKYVWRAPHKGKFNEDLAKAIWYLRMARGDDPRKGE